MNIAVVITLAVLAIVLTLAWHQPLRISDSDFGRKMILIISFIVFWSATCTTGIVYGLVGTWNPMSWIITALAFVVTVWLGRFLIHTVEDPNAHPR